MDIEALRFEVGSLGATPAEVAAWSYRPGGDALDGPVLVCLPGGTYDHGYFDLEVPGHPGYSFAREAVGRGFEVLAVDHLGTGASTRPDHDVTLVDQADALAEVVVGLRDQVGAERPIVAVAHSMGGYVAIEQQARWRSYAALAVLGTTNAHVAPLGLPQEVIEAAATAAGRTDLVEQFRAGMPELYIDAGRQDIGGWFHLADVPPEVVAADTATTLTVVPRAGAAASTVPGVCSDAAAAVDVPVFLAYGETDVSPEPHAEPAFYSSSPDVTLVVVAGSGHCHNMASSRQHLRDRLLGWVDAVTAPASRATTTTT